MRSYELFDKGADHEEILFGCFCYCSYNLLNWHPIFG